MSFWSEASVEPKRKNRWVFNIDGLQEWIVKDVQKPKYNLSKVEHQFGQHTFKYPGRVTWEDVSFTVVDPAVKDLDSARLLVDKIVKGGYLPPVSLQNAIRFISKQAALSVLGTPKIMQLNADGAPIETWSLINAFIMNINFGELSYDGDGDLVTIAMTMSYDYATLDGTALTAGTKQV